MKYAALLIALVYIGLGSYFIFTPSEVINLPQIQKNLLGTTIILYGIFRFYRSYARFFRVKNKDLNESD
jgi:hypothetical protein